MPTQFFLASEVRGPEELEYADFLLSNHPKAKTALDLLLARRVGGASRAEECRDLRKHNEGKANADVERLLC